MKKIGWTDFIMISTDGKAKIHNNYVIEIVEHIQMNFEKEACD